VNVSTVEDPIEMIEPAFNQTQVQPQLDFGFPQGLRALMRQDPDIIMVGEIRDLETAEMAVQAALTGHLVFSTLHTNDAPSTLTRLLNMGVAPFNIASAVTLITAQRLARRLCNCKQPDTIAADALLAAGFTEADLGGWSPYRAVGCERCSGSGYKGRVGVYQVMPVSEAIEAIILAHGTALEIEAHHVDTRQALEGIRADANSGPLRRARSSSPAMRVARADGAAAAGPGAVAGRWVVSVMVVLAPAGLQGLSAGGSMS
jgi:type IV pilus assembly protein PilB